MIAASTNEQHYGLSADGQAVTFPRGTVLVEKDEITLTDSEQASLRGGIYTHNHPGTDYAELSAGDYKLARDLDLQQIRVVDQHGHVTIALKPSTGWPAAWGDFLAEQRYLQCHLLEKGDALKTL